MRARLTRENGDARVGLVAFGLAAFSILAALTMYVYGRVQAEDVKTGSAAIGRANDVSVEADLSQAIRAAEVYLAENGTLSTYGPGPAALYEPALRYNSSGIAVAGQISIRGVGDQTVVLAERSKSGSVLCVGAVADIVTYGRVDAASAHACTGGWQE